MSLLALIGTGAIDATFAAQSTPLPMAKAESVGMSSQRLARIGVVFQREIDRKTMPGAVVAIARRGKLVCYEAFGKLGDDTSVTMPKDAIFAIYSMTKPLTAVGALELFEQARMMLNEPVGTYLPQLDKMVVETPSGTEPARRKPTLQDMMRHTGGVTYGRAEGTETAKRYGELTSTLSADEFLAKLGSLPLQYQPGTKWAYSLVWMSRDWRSSPSRSKGSAPICSRVSLNRWA